MFCSKSNRHANVTRRSNRMLSCYYRRHNIGDILRPKIRDERFEEWAEVFCDQVYDVGNESADTCHAATFQKSRRRKCRGNSRRARSLKKDSSFRYVCIVKSSEYKHFSNENRILYILLYLLVIGSFPGDGWGNPGEWMRLKLNDIHS